VIELTFVTSISAPEADVKKLREQGKSLSKICQQAIKAALAEGEKSEQITESAR
jgi:hypothetical protein